MTEEQELAILWQKLQGEKLRRKVWKQYAVNLRVLVAFLFGFALAGVMFMAINERVAMWKVLAYFLAYGTVFIFLLALAGYIVIRVRYE